MYLYHKNNLFQYNKAHGEMSSMEDMSQQQPFKKPGKQIKWAVLQECVSFIPKTVK